MPPPYRIAPNVQPTIVLNTLSPMYRSWTIRHTMSAATIRKGMKGSLIRCSHQRSVPFSGFGLEGRANRGSSGICGRAGFWGRECSSL